MNTNLLHTKQLPNLLGQPKLLLCERFLLLVFVGFENTRKSEINRQITPNKRFSIIYFLVQILLFEIVLENFSQFLIFCCQQTMMSYIFTQPPHHKKASCSPVCSYFTTTSTQLTASKTYQLPSQLPPIARLPNIARYLTSKLTNSIMML